MRKILSLLLVLCLAFAFAASAFASSGTEDILADILQAKMDELGVSDVQGLVDKLAEKPAAGNEWWIISIRNTFKDIDYSLYREALEKYVRETPPTTLTTRERIALALVAVGSVDSYPADIIDEAVKNEGINAGFFALHLINNGVKSKDYTAMQVAEKLLALQCADGGWCLSGSVGDPDITAMTMQALAALKNEPEISQALERAVAFLSEAQLEDGGYKSYGNTNPESAAQVILALSSIGIDPLKDERFFKNGISLLDSIESFKTGRGQYSHTAGGDSNQTTQTQIYYCFTGYNMVQEGSGLFYVFGPLSEKLIERTPEEQKPEPVNIKLILYIVIAAAVLILCVIKLIKGEKKAKAYLSVIIIGALLAGGVSFINIKGTEEYYKPEDSEHPIFTTISIYCSTVAGKEEHIPADGVILEYKSLQVEDQCSVFDQLVAACKEYKIQLESDAGYVKGISNLYEFSYGDLSGWMFKVNGEFSSVGSSQRKLTDGDYVEWVYTLNLGKDVGNEFSGNQQP